jgi:hypothetical protein
LGHPESLALHWPHPDGLCDTSLATSLTKARKQKKAAETRRMKKLREIQNKRNAEVKGIIRQHNRLRAKKDKSTIEHVGGVKNEDGDGFKYDDAGKDERQDQKKQTIKIISKISNPVEILAPEKSV